MKKITTKIILLTLTSCIIVVATIGVVAIYDIVSLSNQSNQQLDSMLRKNFDTMAKYEIETVVSLLKAIDEKAQKGEITPEYARKLGADLLRKLRYNEDGYFWVDTSEGVNVVLLGKDAEGKNRYDVKDSQGNQFVQEFIEKGTNGGGYTDYLMPKPGEDQSKTFPKRSYTLAFEPFNWVVGTGNYIDDIDEAVAVSKQKSKEKFLKNIVLMLGVIIFTLLIIIALSIYLGKKLSKPIVQVTELIDKTSQFDLISDQSFDSLLNNKDETGSMAKALWNMRKSLSDTVSKLMYVSDNLTSHSQQLTATTEGSSRTISQVVTAINEIAEGNSSQAETISRTNTTTGEMVKTISGIALETSHGAQAAVESMEIVNKGQAAVDLQITQMNENEKVTQEVGESVSDLSSMIEQVGGIVNTITSIAEQTNLLALNAAIEAARAGEAGKGFAVVSEEIRKLAEGSSSAAKEITQIIAQTTSMSKKTVDNMNKAYTIVNEQKEAVTVTKDAFSEIQRSYDGIVQKFQHTAKIMETINKKANHISDQTQDMAAVSEESAASAQEISASSEEQLASIETIAEASKELAKMADDLNQEVRKFKI